MPVRSKRLLLGGCCLWLLIVGFDVLHSTGEVGMTAKNGSGCVCHGFTPSAGVNVWIEGPASVTAGSSTPYQLVMTGGPAAAGGYNVAAAHGSLSPSDTTSQSLDPGTGGSVELTHAAPKPFTGDTVRWAFTYQAPSAAGAETLYSVGNSVDLNGNPTGDGWNDGALKLIAVEPDTAVSVTEGPRPDVAHGSPLLLRCYPNPFNPRTRLVVTTAAPGEIRLDLFSLRGEQVASLLEGRFDRGEHTVEWDASGFASGIYLARLQAASGRAVTQKILLIR